jgi:hypothetical protein
MRHDRRTGREADATLLQVPHHAPDGLAAEPASPAEDHAVDGRHQVTGIEIVEANHVVRPAPLLHGGHGRAIAEQHRDAGARSGVCRVADANPGNAGDHLPAAPGLRLTSASLTRPSATSLATSRPRRARASARG